MRALFLTTFLEIAVYLSVFEKYYFNISGVTYNVSLLRDVLNHPKFRLGDITTKFLPQEYPSGFKGKSLKVVNVSYLYLAVLEGLIYFKHV